jgi:lysophospholipase II
MDPPIPFPTPESIDPQPGHPHTHTVILLHGRNSTGPEFSADLFSEESSAGQSLQQRFPSWKWIFPTSLSSYNATFQEDMHEWFAIESLTDPGLGEEGQREGLKSAVEYVRELVKREAEAVGEANVLLGGISMGCATGLMTLLCGDARVMAFVGLCGWMPFDNCVREQVQGGKESAGRTIEALKERIMMANSVELDASTENHTLKTHVFISHCDDDDVVDISLGRSMRDTLRNLGMQVTYKEYSRGGHWIKEPEGVDDIIAFLEVQTGETVENMS